MTKTDLQLKTDATNVVATTQVDEIAGKAIPITKIVIGAENIDGGFVASGNPLPVSGTITVSSSALPSGAATAALQTSGNALLTTIDTKLATIDNPVAVSGVSFVGSPSLFVIGGGYDNGEEIAARYWAMNSSGHGLVQVVTSALPSGAATAANQSATNSYLVNLSNATGTDGLTGPTKAVSIAGTDGTGVLREIRTSTTGIVQVDVIDSPIEPAVFRDGVVLGTIEGVMVVGTDGTNARALAVNTSGQVQVEIASVESGPIEVNLNADAVGLATEAKQDTLIETIVNVVSEGNIKTSIEAFNAFLPDTMNGDLAAQTLTLVNVATSLQVIDDWDENDRCKVNLIVGQVGVAGGSGAVGATTQRVTLATDVALPAGTNNIGQVTPQPTTSGGCSIFRSIDLDETEEDIKTSAGQLYGLICFNLSASVRYLQIYDGIASGVTVGTTTPVMTIPIPTQGDTNGAGFTISFPFGLAFSTGICVAATTGLTGAGAPGANEVILDAWYK